MTSEQNGAVTNGAFVPDDAEKGGVATIGDDKNLYGNELDTGIDTASPTNGNQQGRIMRKIDEKHEAAVRFIEEHKSAVGTVIAVIAFLLYHAYFGYAMYYKHNAALITFTIMGWCLALWYLVFKPYIYPQCGPLIDTTVKIGRRIFKWYVVLIIQLLCLAAFIAFVLYDSRKNYFRLVPFAGVLMYILLLWILSTNPGKVNWRTVIYGIAMQVVMGLIVLRWDIGFTAFQFLSDQVTIFLGYVDAGTGFVYGFVAKPSPELQKLGAKGVFMFEALSTVILFSSFVAALYYLGLMQWIIVRIGWIFQSCLGTTSAESLCTAGNIFLGQLWGGLSCGFGVTVFSVPGLIAIFVSTTTESPLLVKPYLFKLTKSEIHAIMTSGFATIAGSVFGAYISFGACPVHLLTACVMSAPAALACSKIMCPETEESQTKKMEDMEMEET